MSVLVITGPTGSGKTDLALRLKPAALFNADAFQFYKEIPILTNQPETSPIPIHFLADRSLTQPMNAGAFGRAAEPLLSTPGIWVGIGLYMGAALYGLDAERIRATPFQKQPRKAYKMLVIDFARDLLYRRLDARVDQMMAKGAVDEARKVLEMLKDSQLKVDNPALKAIGLSHLLRHLKGEASLEETLRHWKRDTRRLAKRQMTWLRKFCAPSENILWVKGENMKFEEIADFFRIS